MSLPINHTLKMSDSNTKFTLCCLSALIGSLVQFWVETTVTVTTTKNYIDIQQFKDDFMHPNINIYRNGTTVHDSRSLFFSLAGVSNIYIN